MNYKIVAPLLLFVSLATSAQQTANLTMSGSTLLTGTSVTVEIYDDVCKKSIGQFTVTGPDGATQVGPLCVSNSGYITIKKRKLPNNIWVGQPWLKPGETFDP